MLDRCRNSHPVCGVVMSDFIFQAAYSRVRGHYDDQSWFALSPQQITDSIYREIRAIDRERMIKRSGKDKSAAAVAE